MRSNVLALVLGALVASPVALADTDVPSAKLFPSASSRLREDAAADKFLTAVAQHVGENAERRLRVIVHTDERIGTIDNTALGDLRAKRLVKELRKRGIRKNQLRAEIVGHSGVEHTPETSRITFDFDPDAVVSWPNDAP